MKVLSNNFSGSLPLEYKIQTRRFGGSEFVQLCLNLRLPGSSEFSFFDSVTGLEGKTFTENLHIAYIKAEAKWDMNLIKFEEEHLTTTKDERE